MKIIIVDDHGLLRESLALLLRETYGDSVSVLLADNGCSALQQVDSLPELDLILLDINLPDMHGFQVIQELKNRMPKTPVIALSGTIVPQFIQQCIALGAAGFIPKTFTGNEMIAAIDVVLHGRVFIPAEALLSLSGNENDKKDSSPSALTVRQIDVLRLIQKGLSNDEIASVLQIKKTTVKTHVGGVLACLGVKNRTEAVNEALLLHLL